MDKPIAVENTPVSEPAPQAAQQAYQRFTRAQRIEHFLFLLSFTILGITGLAQRYADTQVGLAVLEAFGGIEGARTIHHASAFVMMWISVYHMIAVLYRVFVLRVPWTMLPVIDDFKHLFHDLGYYFGLRKHKAYYGRYNYGEKVEYLAVVWGTIVMGLTGFMMWNPLTTTQYLPGQVIPAAKVAHSAEAVLAVLAIIIWHMYHVHIKYFNKSMFNGKLSREEMEEEHPAELKLIETGAGWKRPEDATLRKRQMAFTPIAILIALVLSGGVIWFITVEPATAITTLPQGETAAVFVPVTPTPRPTLQPTPTAERAAGISADSWEGNYAALFKNRCGTCHVSGNLGGLSLATYQNALKGGNGGPGVVPGFPDSSSVVTIQAAGNHPGQLTIDELDQVIEWIKAGAPER
jgi:formate dehydrogenase gamma subunit